MVVAEWRFASLVLLTAVLRVGYAPSPRVGARARLPQAGINLGGDLVGVPRVPGSHLLNTAMPLLPPKSNLLHLKLCSLSFPKIQKLRTVFKPEVLSMNEFQVLS